MATIYRGRVVGCSAVGYSNGVATVRGPAFPKMAFGHFSRSRGTEGAGLGHGIDYLVGAILPKWLPATTNHSTLTANFACLQNSTSNTNSNQASVFQNVARALWEWLDTSTAQFDTSDVDNSDISLKQLMDGLKYLQEKPGTLDGQGGEASFVPNATTCDNNENCTSLGQACAMQTGAFKFCATGDVHGSNLRDLATALNDLVTTGRGTLMTSAKSTHCMNGPDTAIPFGGNAGYRGD